MDILRSTWSKSYEWTKHWQIVLEAKVKHVGRGQYGRVLKMARKPTSEEYSKTIIVTGIGIAIIGALGFIIYLIWEYLPDVVDWFGV
ncbi:MAG: protein translocase SEC61 complex subunit gamma [Candidatus Thermoplasmatota archaeon]|jgi:protein transport protein SEC61 subunit gamma-like protein|nr:protein translocase SEC61 complex subunit gamma [Candidatus Thermoplasmatota archaeon]